MRNRRKSSSSIWISNLSEHKKAGSTDLFCYLALLGQGVGCGISQGPGTSTVPKSAGEVKKIDAELIGRASVQLGAGRQKADAPTDFAVGFSKIKKVGEHVDLNEPLFVIHARNERSIVNIRPLLEKAVELE